MKYIRKFATEAEYNAASANLPTPNIVLIEENMSDADGGIILNKYVEPAHDYANDYFTVVAVGDIEVQFYTAQSGNGLSYSVDNGATWTPYDMVYGDYEYLNLSDGEKMLWKGSLKDITTDSNNYFTFMGGDVNLEGNIMSLLYGDNFVGQLDLPNDEGYVSRLSSLFGSQSVISAENLILPATGLTTSCYVGMFNWCQSLTTAPQLPAATLVDWCYANMFQGCTSLNSVTCLATDISAENCLDSWLNGVAANGTFTKAAGSVWPSGDSGIPDGWTVEEV